MKVKKKKLNVKNYKIAGYNSIKKLTIIFDKRCRPYLVHGCSNWRWAIVINLTPLFALTGLNLAKFYFKFLLHFAAYSNFRVILNFTFFVLCNGYFSHFYLS